jgi:acyl phosphate:glycerol-3-phosphate acyltransferase
LIVFISILAGYLVGSIPTAYLVVRTKAGLDLRTQGSRNVGALNAYDVTLSKKTGILVGILDGLKGLVVAFIAGQVLGTTFWTQSLALLGCIIGHNYPIWLRFHGGRGLSTAAGGMFAIGISYTIVWCLIWFISSRIFKDILNMNLAAIIIAPIVTFLLPFTWIEASMVRCAAVSDYRLFSFVLSGILLISHWDAVKILLNMNSTL